MFDVVSYGVTDDVAHVGRQLTRHRGEESEDVSLLRYFPETTKMLSAQSAVSRC